MIKLFFYWLFNRSKTLQHLNEIYAQKKIDDYMKSIKKPGT